MPPRIKPLKTPLSRELGHGRILIVCEGKQTEPNYFNKFREKLLALKKNRTEDIVIDILPAKHPAAKHVFDDARQKKESITPRYSEVWCVFDKDRNTDDVYNQLIAKKAKEENIHIAYSNPCFELWFLLHFDYCDNRLSGKDCEKKLCNRMQRYSKTDTELFDRVTDKQAVAIKRAETLMNTWEGRTDFAKHNPSTTVHKLVEMLNEYLKKVENTAK
jgi:hypothetical protein